MKFRRIWVKEPGPICQKGVLYLYRRRTGPLQCRSKRLATQELPLLPVNLYSHSLYPNGAGTLNSAGKLDRSALFYSLQFSLFWFSGLIVTFTCQLLDNPRVTGVFSSPASPRRYCSVGNPHCRSKKKKNCELMYRAKACSLWLSTNCSHVRAHDVQLFTNTRIDNATRTRLTAYNKLRDDSLFDLPISKNLLLYVRHGLALTPIGPWGISPAVR